MLFSESTLQVDQYSIKQVKNTFFHQIQEQQAKKICFSCFREFSSKRRPSFKQDCLVYTKCETTLLPFSIIKLKIDAYSIFIKVLYQKAINGFIRRTGAQPVIFQSREGFVEFGHFDKHLVKNIRRIRLCRLFACLEFFLLDPLKRHFEWKV